MLTKLSVKKPYTVVVAVALIILLGITALIGIKTDLLPDVDYPYVVVITPYEDASPEEVESTVTKQVEEALASVSHIKHISSISTEGKSIVEVEFDQNADMDSVVAEIRECFEPLKDDWGSSVGTPVIKKINPATMPVVVASLDVEGEDAAGISSFINDNLMSYFNGIDGIADVSIIGMVDEQIQITIDQEKLATVNETIYNAIDGDYEKARAALNATDAELNSASSRLSSDLLNQTAAIDSQVRSLNSEIARAEATVTSKQTEKDSLSEEIATLTEEKATLAAKEILTAEETARLAEIETKLTADNKELTEIQSDINEAQATVNSREDQIATLQSQRAALTTQMSSAEAEIAGSKSSITNQLSELDVSEESAKAEADLEALITIDMVSSMLSAQNFSSTAGSLALGNKEYSVKVGDKIDSVEELQNLVLFHFNIEGVENVLLSDVANVDTVNNSDDIYAKINGRDGVLISFMKQSDGSAAAAAANVWSVLNTVSSKYPAVTVTPLSDQSVYLNRVIGAVGENLIIGAVLAVLILILFLRDIRPTLVVAISIPASILFAVVLMYFTGVTLNIFSLTGLALGVGMLVDNAIVVMDNIYRCRSIGLSSKDAAIEGTKQVGGAIIASTLTTICVFLPLVFTNGLSRELFTDIGLTIAYALLASLFIAFTLIPALSAGLLKRMDRRHRSAKEPVKDKYEAILRWVLDHRVFTLLFVLMLLIFSVIFAVSRGTSFMPKADSTEMTLTVTMQEPATESVLWQTTDKVVSLLMEMDDVSSVGAVQDTGGTISLNGTSEGNSTTVYVVLKDEKEHLSSELSDMILKDTENLGCDIDISIGSYDLSSLYQEGVNIVIRGDDLGVLSNIADDMGDLLLSVDGITNVKDTTDTATPSLKVTVDKTAAMNYGLTVSEVYDFIADAISNSANATSLSDTDVIVIDDSAEDIGLADIQNLTMEVTDDDGNISSVTIGSIATITEEAGAPVIYRNNQERYMTASAEVADGYNVGLISEEVTELIAGYTIPEGYSITIEGESSVIGDSLYDLMLILGLALLLMYLIMVAQFQSLLSPFIVMITVPLAFTGGFIALLLSGKDISVVAVVGFLLLSGVIVNNGIVLVDYINQLRKSGKLLTAAIIEGGRTRLRPIVMTAATTALAPVTLACGFGMGAEMIQPMAIVIIGGMIYATFMTLFVVPALYDLLLRRGEDDIAELGLEYYANDEGKRESYLMERRKDRGLEDNEKEKEEDDDDDDEEKPGFFQRIFKGKRKDGDLEEDDEDEEEDGTDEEEEPRLGLFRRRKKIEEDDEDEDEDAEEDAEEPVKNRRFPWFGRHFRDEEEAEMDQDDDEDYYGLKERRARYHFNEIKGSTGENGLPEAALTEKIKGEANGGKTPPQPKNKSPENHRRLGREQEYTDGKSRKQRDRNQLSKIGRRGHH